MYLDNKNEPARSKLSKVRARQRDTQSQKQMWPNSLISHNALIGDNESMAAQLLLYLINTHICQFYQASNTVLSDDITVTLRYTHM